jgi:hypothetical protein
MPGVTELAMASRIDTIGTSATTNRRPVKDVASYVHV